MLRERCDVDRHEEFSYVDGMLSQLSKALTIHNQPAYVWNLIYIDFLHLGINESDSRYEIRPSVETWI